MADAVPPDSDTDTVMGSVVVMGRGTLSVTDIDRVLETDREIEVDTDAVYDVDGDVDCVLVRDAETVPWDEDSVTSSVPVIAIEAVTEPDRVVLTDADSTSDWVAVMGMDVVVLTVFEVDPDAVVVTEAVWALVRVAVAGRDSVTVDDWDPEGLTEADTDAEADCVVDLVTDPDRLWVSLCGIVCVTLAPLAVMVDAMDSVAVTLSEMDVEAL